MPIYPCCGHCDPDELKADSSLNIEVGCTEAPHTEPCPGEPGAPCVGGSIPVG